MFHPIYNSTQNLTWGLLRILLIMDCLRTSVFAMLSLAPDGPLPAMRERKAAVGAKRRAITFLWAFEDFGAAIFFASVALSCKDGIHQKID